MRIHKYTGNFCFDVTVLCKKIGVGNTARNWEDVTCKDCLKQRKAKKIHRFSKKDNNTILGRTTVCGLPESFFSEEEENKVWRKVTCKNCLKVRLTKQRSKNNG